MRALKLTAICALAAGLATAVQNAWTQCVSPTKKAHPTTWEHRFVAPRLMLIGAEDPDQREQAIVGMWHVVFTANTSQGAAIPATVIDNALVVWHSDHTEIMNSVRPPRDGNFCLGVWEQLSRNEYYLNHFPWYGNEFPNNNANGIGDAVGPTQVQEWVTLAPDGSHFTGNFKLTAYDLSNNVIAAFTGTLAGTRITVKTTEGELVSN